MGPRLCTGTLITSHVVLTASHCIESEHPAIVVLGAGLAAKRAVKLGPGKKMDFQDVGLLIFEVSVQERLQSPPLELAAPVRRGTPVTMIGYGCRQRAVGTNPIFRVKDFIELLWSRPREGGLQITGPSNRAESCPGDSGSPALVEQDGKWKIAGVLHGLMIDSSVATPLSVYSNVTLGANRDFLVQQIRLGH